MRGVAQWVLSVILFAVGVVGCRACPRGPTGRRPPAAGVVAVTEGGEPWGFRFGALGSWLSHELTDEVRLWRRGRGEGAHWSRRGRRILLNGRNHGVDLTGLPPAHVARWLSHHRAWEDWVVLDAGALSPGVLRVLGRARRLGLALRCAPGARPPMRALAGLGRRLVALSLKEATLTRSDLARLGGLRRLEALSLAGARLEADAMQGFPPLGSLRLLDLTDVGLRSLGSLSALVGLRRLLLSGTAVSDASLEALGGMARLRALDLARTPVSDFGVDRLVGLAGLRSLDLADTAVTDLGADLLAELAGLRVLRLGPNITDLALAHLADLRGLEVLALRRTGITGTGVSRLAVLRRLVSLDLAWTDIGDPALRHLRGLTRLRHLNLGRTRVTGSGLRHLYRARGLAVLGLRWTPLLPRHQSVLAGLRALRRVDLAGTVWRWSRPGRELSSSPGRDPPGTTPSAAK